MAESPLLDRYVERYGQDAATVATVIALAQRAESFDRAIYDTESVEAFFYRVPHSTLIVKRVETNDQYGVSRTFTVLDEDEPLFAIGPSGQLEFNHLTLTQIETLQTAQQESASPLLVHESYLQADMAQGLTKDGEAQARAILSQGDVITPDMVTSLNDLMAAEEDIRQADQADQGFMRTVRYPQFTEYELNQNLSADTIARQLSAQSPVVEVQAATQPLQQPELSSMPNVYDRPRSEIERMETLATRLLQAGETLVAPAKFTDDGRPLLPPLRLTLSDQFQDGQPLIQRVYRETAYSPGQRSLHPPSVLHDGVLQAMQDGTLETADGQPVRLPDLLTWEQLNAPALNQVEELGYVLTQDAESAYRQQWTSNRPLPSLAESIRAIPDYEGGVPTLKQLLDGQLTLLQQPQVSLEQGRIQVELQAPPASSVERNGQREAAAPVPLSPVAPKVQPPTLKPKGDAMTVIENPTPVDLKPIQLDDMLSEFGKDAMRGITGTRNTFNPSTKVRGSEERTPGETFAKFAKGAYGIENFCKDNGIPYQGSADYLVNKTALELDLSPEFKAEILSGIKREECVAPVILATESEAAAWKRVYELQPETFAAVATPTMQETIAQDASVIAQAKAKTLETLGITMKTAEPTRDPAKLGYEPVPATPETAALMAFRDSLTASQLREWATAVQVNEPQNTDKQKWVADFTAKFQKSGYEMSDGGMSVGMAKRLTEVQQQMGPDVQQLRTEMVATINQMLSQAPQVEGKDDKKLEAAKLGLTIKGNEGNFEVKGATGKLLMLAKEGDVTINRLPATVVSRMEGMVAMQQQMQQAVVQQRTVALPAKKAAAVER